MRRRKRAIKDIKQRAKAAPERPTKSSIWPVVAPCRSAGPVIIFDGPVTIDLQPNRRNSESPLALAATAKPSWLTSCSRLNWRDVSLGPE